MKTLTERLREPADLDDLLLFRLSRLLSTGSTMVIRLCEGGFGITRREWRLIALLARQSGLLSSVLADQVELDRSRTSRAVTSLVAKGLVRRERGPADRREARLSLTEQGRDVHDRLFPLVAHINRELLAALDGRTLDLLAEALDSLQARADQLQAQQDAGLPRADRRLGGRARPPA